MKSRGSEEGKKGGSRQNIPRKTCRRRCFISERDGESIGRGWTTESWEETGTGVVVWAQPHLCFVCLPGNGFQVTGSSLLSLEPRP